MSVKGVRLSPGQTTNVGTVVVDSGLVLQGTVRTRSGEAIPYVRVAAVESTAAHSRRLGGNSARASRSIVAGSDGAFELPHLLEGPNRVTVSATGYVTLEEVDVRAGMAYDFKLSEAGRVECVVDALRTLELVPADGRNEGFAQRQDSQKDGLIVFTGVPEGRFIARERGREPLAEVEVRSGATTEVVLHAE